MSTLASILTAQPSVQYRRNEAFYYQYDGAWILAIFAVAVGLHLSGWQPWISEYSQWSHWYFLLLLPLYYVHVQLNVFVHNCCHCNFPRSINRLVGEVCGLLVFTRFASWEVLHTRHHKYSDDPEKDPHPIVPSFALYLYNTMLFSVERQLQNVRYDQFGDTRDNRRKEFHRALLSYLTMGVLTLTVISFLGPWVSFLLVLPVQLLGWLTIAHFNWATHDPHDPLGDYKPVNLDTGWYWIGNRIWFGLYQHANHHQRANIFNPLKMDEVVAKRKAARARSEAAAA